MSIGSCGMVVHHTWTVCPESKMDLLYRAYDMIGRYCDGFRMKGLENHGIQRTIT